jgi:hypothetical protein
MDKKHALRSLFVLSAVLLLSLVFAFGYYIPSNISLSPPESLCEGWVDNCKIESSEKSDTFAREVDAQADALTRCEESTRAAQESYIQCSQELQTACSTQPGCQPVEIKLEDSLNTFCKISYCNEVLLTTTGSRRVCLYKYDDENRKIEPSRCWDYAPNEMPLGWSCTAGSGRANSVVKCNGE